MKEHIHKHPPTRTHTRITCTHTHTSHTHRHTQLPTLRPTHARTPAYMQTTYIPTPSRTHTLIHTLAHTSPTPTPRTNSRVHVYFCAVGLTFAITRFIILQVTFQRKLQISIVSHMEADFCSHYSFISCALS